jgi:F-type H+-transporting ATPase subunit epsilon
MADTHADPNKVTFELVSPEKLLLSRPVDMVVVPGSEGDFGVLVRHAPVISNVRPGVIEVHEDGKVSERIFIVGGFAEVTGERCTVLADRAMPVSELDRQAAEQQLKDSREDLADAKTDPERVAAGERIAVAEAMLQALSR